MFASTPKQSSGKKINTNKAGKAKAVSSGNSPSNGRELSGSTNASAITTPSSTPTWCISSPEQTPTPTAMLTQGQLTAGGSNVTIASARSSSEALHGMLLLNEESDNNQVGERGQDAHGEPVWYDEDKEDEGIFFDGDDEAEGFSDEESEDEPENASNHSRQR
jgi:hypothetical protein